MRAFIPVLVMALLPACGAANVDRSPRPELRPDAPVRTDFATWRAGFERRAAAAGITPDTLASARPYLRPLPDTLALDRRQSEFGARVWEYLDSAVNAERIRAGRAAMARHKTTLDRIESRFGVPPEIVAAIWGIETSYGANRGRTPILATLATLAKDGRRAAFFEDELIAALRMVQQGKVAPARFNGSWAGAFGHTQFMPSSYLTYALPLSGDGVADVWADTPEDALASAANYLERRGWMRGQPWAVEVRLPDQFDLGQTGQRRSDWGDLGVTAVQGRLPDAPARLLLPGGARGPAFLATDNYDVLKEYNMSDAYVLALGHLSDRLRGAGPLRGQWPRGDRALTRAERLEVQRILTAQGYDTGGIDGRHGPATIAAVQAWQRAAGLPPDGYINADLLSRLRR
ncbi:MAG: membrane-bound lytic murein transglycosylase MltB [Roseibaca calidilacus]|uniref:Membrane-bound lytic murein transglycosylase B n=1 Tax=Roseibaca calidilacus TaxID=1666912 RepID=A0A0P7WTF8_9RHOB|nr:lytic murein transglycosylase [Roseibaca calidilacus]KPP94176.1 MAG: membrane-bound lytic murein transglycosylase MltB [Roseibaca calidilacus]CUX81427.1 membrane-bound lytic murein transglycosylase B [Roseibaca calidilacus]